MDNMGDWGQQTNLLNELAQGREIARHLHQLLNVPSSSHETRELMVEKIIATFEKTLAMVNLTGSSMVEQPSQPTGAAIPMSESPPLSLSPRSEDSDRDFKDHEQKDACNNSKKNMPRWTKQIRVSPEIGLQGSIEDGYSWRKYGQKDILGAKYPRSYYRCTHRNVQGCLATKQVQRSDEDPTILEITYRGRHTCSQASNTNNTPPSSVENPETLTDTNIFQQQQQSEDMVMSVREALRVETENLGTHYQTTPAFYFPSSSDFQVESPVFSTCMDFSPSYLTPATSGVNHLSSGMNSFGGNHSFPSSESELNDIISAATSAANSPTIGLDYPFGHVEFEPNFSFNNHGFFS